jgi:hypothetical protein
VVVKRPKSSQLYLQAQKGFVPQAKPPPIASLVGCYRSSLAFALFQALVHSSTLEELGEVFEEEGESEDEAEEAPGIASRDLLDFMRGFGHMQANDSGWPLFDGRYASYP